MRSLARLLPALALSAACGTNSGTPADGTGGKPSGNTAGSSAIGGAQNGGGSTSIGGSSVVQPGGGMSAGGTSSSTGGGIGNAGTTGQFAGAGGTSSSAGGSSAGGTSSSTGGSSAGGGGPAGNAYNPGFVEFSGSDCTVPDPKDVNFATLNDLFLMADGVTRMSKKSDWRCQRAYLKKVVEKYIHGAKPGKPATVTGTVSATAIKVHVEDAGKMIDFSVPVTMPSGASGPVPIIIGLGGSSLDAGIVSGEGVASGNYDHQAMASETSRTGLFTTITGSNGASAQIGWAWGVSRVIDVLIAERDAGRNNVIDPTAVGVTGCSRNGKGAFTVGAFDERIALGIPQESGTAGVSALRIVNTAPKGPNGNPAQSISSAMSEAAGWFGAVFGSYSSKVNTIPGDTHSIVAMYAPRGLLVLDNSRIGELCATCQHGASAAGALVYQALGVEKNIEYNGGNPGDPHNHCTFYPATQGDPLKRAIRAFLTKKAAPDGRIAPQPAGTADLTKWITWTAPTLADDVSWGSPPLTSK